MAVAPSEEFLDWLLVRIEATGMTEAKFLRKADLASSTLSKLKTGSKIGHETAAKIADALQLPRSALYIKAGLDPKEPDMEPSILEVLTLFVQMSEDERESELAEMRSRLKLRKKGKHAEVASANH
mgnify:FL=1